jgi:hypothetical protein
MKQSKIFQLEELGDQMSDVPDIPLPHLWEVSQSNSFTMLPVQSLLGITALFFSGCYSIRATDPISFVNTSADPKEQPD